MKIQCDVCGKKEASVFCSADEAALCDVCDQRVHHANKLASKHHRFSLIHPSPSLAPICDICQEKRALVFCQQDRAILCRECEVPLHEANEHTQKHNRFLLTGIKLSPICLDHDNNPSVKNINRGDTVPDFKPAKEQPICASSEISPVSSNNYNYNNGNTDQQLSGSGDGSTSSISEYLIETLPGWHFEDFFLDSASNASFAFCKNDLKVGEDMMSFWDVDFGTQLTESCQYENLGIRVPQAPAAAAAKLTTLTAKPTSVGFGGQLHKENGGIVVNNNNQGAKQQETTANANAVTKVSRKWRKDDGFTVPQIIQSVGSNNINKRPRTFW